MKSGYKWFPYNKGGDYRKHYGNKEYVLSYDNESYQIMCTIGNKLPSRQLYFRPMISWTDATAYKISLRYYDYGYLFGTAGPAIFCDNHHYIVNVQAYLNSCVSEHILKIVCASVHYNPGDVSIVPIKKSIVQNERSFDIELDNIELSKLDWNSYETSWDFKAHPLI